MKDFIFSCDTFTTSVRFISFSWFPDPIGELDSVLWRRKLKNEKISLSLAPSVSPAG